MSRKVVPLLQGQGQGCAQKNSAHIAKSNKSAAKPIARNNTIKPFAGTNNLAELRAINALMMADGGVISRNELDAACGSSNSPEIIRRLRAKGLPIACEIKGTVNRFGEPVKAGFYSLTSHGRAKLRLWLREKAREVQ